MAMGQAEFLAKFIETDARGMQKVIAAGDSRSFRLADFYAEFGYYDPKQADGITHDYGLEPWDADDVIRINLCYEGPRHG